MQVVVKGRHVQVSDEIRKYISEKAPRLAKYYDRINEVEVILDHESEQFSAEIIVRVIPQQTFVAQATGPDTFSLIDGLLDKIERQLTKHKEKQRNHKGRNSADGVNGEIKS
jgi:putative sigma-54 modulation protein